MNYIRITALFCLIVVAPSCMRVNKWLKSEESQPATSSEFSLLDKNKDGVISPDEFPHTNITPQNPVYTDDSKIAWKVLVCIGLIIAVCCFTPFICTSKVLNKCRDGYHKALEVFKINFTRLRLWVISCFQRKPKDDHEKT